MDTDEHIQVVEHQLQQHLSDGDPSKLWRALAQASEKVSRPLCKTTGNAKLPQGEDDIERNLTISYH